MSRVWGREETYRWPSDKPVWTLTVMVLAVLAMAGAAFYQYQWQWTFLQQAYLKTYISTERTWLKSAPYPILYRVEGKQQRPAVDADLSDPAVLSRKAKLQWERGEYNNAELARWLETAIYSGESPWAKLWEWMWKVGALVFGVGFLFSAPRDYQRQRIRKYGRRTKGPELATAAQFNGANRQSANGIGFLTRERRTLGEFLLQREGKIVRVPRERESSHFLMIGDTGAGKSSLIRQVLMQVEGRGETAIVYDPALEYAPQFYEPGRGDLILNPLDARCPYWSPCDEVIHEAEALTLATSLFPVSLQV